MVLVCLARERRPRQIGGIEARDPPFQVPSGTRLMLKENVEPCCSADSTVNRPPNLWTIFLQIASHAGSGILAGVVQPLEGLENAVLILRVDPDAVVLHAEDPFVGRGPGRYMNPGRVSGSDIFDRVADQVSAAGAKSESELRKSRKLIVRDDGI